MPAVSYCLAFLQLRLAAFADELGAAAVSRLPKPPNSPSLAVVDGVVTSHVESSLEALRSPFGLSCRGRCRFAYRPWPSMRLSCTARSQWRCGAPFGAGSGRQPQAPRSCGLELSAWPISGAFDVLLYEERPCGSVNLGDLS